jgi:hypothetical protein
MKIYLRRNRSEIEFTEDSMHWGAVIVLMDL